MSKNRANFVPLTPVSFLHRAATVYPEKTAVIHGDRAYSYREFHERACRLASALAKRGISHGDTVSIMAPNVPEMLEAHYAVPMLGAILNPLNIRLDGKTIAFILEHGEAKALITDREFSPVIKQALATMETRPLLIDIDDILAEGGELLGDIGYEELLAEGDPHAAFDEPKDELQSVCLLYTSGTTGNPKGVLYHHRGTYLNALGNMTAMSLNWKSVYLWTLPMFHCNG
ncbi:MAG: AMP-binding protein, partial [Chloroflexi bacterium]|nr:AMP-binding protein [Chloroflexota bacterium]